jgi:type IV conjugative transfer system protein TraL
MTQLTRFFNVPKHLDQPKTLCGFPADEIAPGLSVFIIAFILQSELFGGLLGCIWFVSLRLLKQNYGEYCISLFFFHLAPEKIMSVMFKKTPQAKRIHWIF